MLVEGYDGWSHERLTKGSELRRLAREYELTCFEGWDQMLLSKEEVNILKDNSISNEPMIESFNGF